MDSCLIIGESRKMPRQYAMCSLDEEYRKRLTEIMRQQQSLNKHEFYNAFIKEEYFIFLGEIPNMLGHCVVVGESGRTYAAFHTEDFVEIEDD